MEQADNSIESIQYRKYSKRLAISGLAMIMLSVWSFFRLVLEMYSDRHILKRMIIEAAEKTPNMTIDDGLLILKVLLALILIGFFFSVILHLFIGIQAVRDGFGMKSTVIYLIFALLVAHSAVSSFTDSRTIVENVADFMSGAGKTEEADGEDEEDEDDEDELFAEDEDFDDEDDPFIDEEDAEEELDELFSDTDDAEYEDTVISSIILDVTTVIICFEMLYCSIRKRILKSAMKG